MYCVVVIFSSSIFLSLDSRKDPALINKEEKTICGREIEIERISQVEGCYRNVRLMKVVHEKCTRLC